MTPPPPNRAERYAKGKSLRKVTPRGAHGKLAEMHEMPVVGRTVLGHVLAHGRDDNAIGQREAAQLEGAEQGAGHRRWKSVEAGPRNGGGA